MGKAYVEKIEIHEDQIGAWLNSEEMRQIITPAAEQIYEAIAPSDGVPGAQRDDGVKQVNGRYREKYIDRNATANDGSRAAIDVGVHGADHGVFRLMLLQRAVRAIGGKVRRRRGA